LPKTESALSIALAAGTYALTRHQRDTLTPRVNENSSISTDLPPASDHNLYLEQRVAYSSSLIEAEISIPALLQDLSIRDEQHHGSSAIVSP
jgi:hypothetical protein